MPFRCGPALLCSCWQHTGKSKVASAKKQKQKTSPPFFFCILRPCCGTAVGSTVKIICSHTMGQMVAPWGGLTQQQDRGRPQLLLPTGCGSKQRFPSVHLEGTNSCHTSDTDYLCHSRPPFPTNTRTLCGDWLPENPFAQEATLRDQFWHKSRIKKYNKEKQD